MKDLVPLFLDLTDRDVLVFGGGEVALRKARLFADRARVRVVSEAFRPEFDDLPVEQVLARVEDPEGHLDAAFLVVPATDDSALNARIVAAARARGCLVDAVEGEGDVVVPAIVRKGDLVVAISTSGRSPALARHLKERVEQVLGPAYEAVLDIQGRLRDLLKAEVPDQPHRAALLHQVLEDPAVWEALERDDGEAAWDQALKRVRSGEPGGPEPARSKLK